jgi:hypothetical protein
MIENALENPIFLVASVRSGTTLLAVMLDHHPEIAFPGEFEFSVDLLEAGGELPNMESFHAWLRVNRHFLWHGLEIDPSLDYPELVRSFLFQMKQAGNGGAKQHVGVSVHRSFEHLPDLWPEGRYIHLLRDPRDVGASIMVEGWAGNHFTGARQWRETEESWERLKARIPPERWIEIRFENLASDTHSTLSRVCDFIGVPYRGEMMTYPENSTYSAVNPGIRERWRRKQTPREVQLSEAGAGEMLEQRGYEWSGEPRLSVGLTRTRLIELHCRLVRLRWRLKRYGFRLWIERRLAQALAIQAWQDSVELREHEITNRYLK